MGRSLGMEDLSLKLVWTVGCDSRFAVVNYVIKRGTS
jgi:hypothetical protein